jgi:hypothetical protein
MGRLTADTVRLVADVHRGRADRQRLLQVLQNATTDRKTLMSRSQADDRRTRRAMAALQHRNLQEFVSTLRKTVGGLRNDLGADLAGARSAWCGMPGHQQKRRVDRARL